MLGLEAKKFDSKNQGDDFLGIANLLILGTTNVKLIIYKYPDSSGKSKVEQERVVTLLSTFYDQNRNLTLQLSHQDSDMRFLVTNDVSVDSKNPIFTLLVTPYRQNMWATVEFLNNDNGIMVPLKGEKLCLTGTMGALISMNRRREY